jgi:hypothetical protein
MRFVGVDLAWTTKGRTGLCAVEDGVVTASTTVSGDGVTFWAVLGHPEVQEVSRSWQRFSSLEGPSLTKTAKERSGHTIIASDPPGHTRMRKLVNAGFTPRMIARLDELVVQRATEVLDAAAAKNDVNFVREVAYQLPMHLISDIMGIPESDRPDVFRWTDLITRAADPLQGISDAEQTAAERALFAYALPQDQRAVVHLTDVTDGRRASEQRMNVIAVRHRPFHGAENQFEFLSHDTFHFEELVFVFGSKLLRTAEIEEVVELLPAFKVVFQPQDEMVQLFVAHRIRASFGSQSARRQEDDGSSSQFTRG